MVGTAFQSASSGLVKHVKLLLRSGLNVNIKNDKGQNLLVAALRVDDPRKRYQMFRMLLRRGTNVFSVDHSTERDVLLWACVLNRHEEIKLILQEGMSGLDLCKRDNGGYTGLHYVVMNGNRETCKILCQAIVKIGLSVDVANNDGFTPYILAKRLGHCDCVEVLKIIGRASTYQFDTSQYKMADSWGVEGEKEMSHVDKRLKAKKVVALKALGRMSQLHDANYKPSKVKIIASKHEKVLVNVMFPGKVNRPWSAPSTEDNQQGPYHDRLSKELQAIYEAKALKKASKPANVSVPEREITFLKPSIPKIRIKLNDVDLYTSGGGATLPPLRPVMRYSKSMPNLSTTDTDCESPKSSRSPFSPRIRKIPPSVRTEHWYPPSSSEIWKRRGFEKENIPRENVQKAATVVVKTSISQLLGVMAEQRAAAPLGKPKERVKLLPIDKDVANIIKTRKEAVEMANKAKLEMVTDSSAQVTRRARKLTGDQTGLEIIREE